LGCSLICQGKLNQLTYIQPLPLQPLHIIFPLPLHFGQTAYVICVPLEDVIVPVRIFPVPAHWPQTRYPVPLQAACLVAAKIVPEPITKNATAMININRFLLIAKTPSCCL